MDFVDVGYSYLMPFLMVVYLLKFKKYQSFITAIIQTVNVSLLFFFIYQCWDYYNLYKLAAVFGVEITAKGLWLLMQTNKIIAIKNTLLLLLPLMAFLKLPSRSILFSAIMLVLIWWDVAMAIFTNTSYTLPIKMYSPLSFSIIKYICLLVAIYAFLWLRKKYNFQRS
ncbi:MAG: hypothetical protein ACOVNY_01985 [Chitinophagaceae bacterium]